MRLADVIQTLQDLQGLYGKDVEVIAWDCNDKCVLHVERIIEMYPEEPIDPLVSNPLNIEIWIK